MSHICPKCSQKAQSLAAINYKETTFANTQGSFSGAGIGTGGIMLGGGTYSGHTTTQTKRAEKLGEPGEFQLPVASLMIVGTVVGMALMTGPKIFGDMMSASSDNVSATANLAPVIDIAVKALPFIAIYIIGLFLYRAYKNQETNDKLNETVLPKLQDRYASLGYCEHCHVIFDENGIFEPANESGYNKMMAIEV